MKIKYKSVPLDTRVRLFWILSGVLLISLLIYIYGISAVIHHTVSRKNLTAESAELLEKVSELEFRTIALKNTINLDIALSRGFVEVRNPLYVSRYGGTLTLNTKER